jgi:nitric oxide dioxygenase
LLIGRETALYSAQASTLGGWTGWREFRVRDKVRESEVITSFVLAPADGGTVTRHKPGQYLTLWLDIPGRAPLKRNYSISSGPSDAIYRITVKREPQGVASNWLHDAVAIGAPLKIGAPAGEFVMEKPPQICRLKIPHFVAV